MMVLIDSSSLIYSAFFKYGIYNHRNEPVAIIFGFFKKVIQLADKYKTSNLVFCFDSSFSLRREVYSDYKKNRRKIKEEDIVLANLRKKQAIRIKTELRKMGFNNVFIKHKYEADDLLAFIVEERQDRKNTIMVTNDKDMFQCLDNCNLLNPKDNKFYDRKRFLEEYKIDPNQWPLAKAIGGCNSDNIKGIKGASDPKNTGSKALSYLRKELKKGKILERIESKEGKAIIKRNIKLTKCPYLNKDFGLTIRQNQITRQKIMDFVIRYRFQKLLEKDTWKVLLND